MVKLNTPMINIEIKSCNLVNSSPSTALQYTLTKVPLKVKFGTTQYAKIDVAIKMLDSLRLQALLANMLAHILHFDIQGKSEINFKLKVKMNKRLGPYIWFC